MWWKHSNCFLYGIIKVQKHLRHFFNFNKKLEKNEPSQPLSFFYSRRPPLHPLKSQSCWNFEVQSALGDGKKGSLPWPGSGLATPAGASGRRLEEEEQRRFPPGPCLYGGINTLLGERRTDPQPSVPDFHRNQFTAQIWGRRPIFPRTTPCFNRKSLLCHSQKSLFCDGWLFFSGFREACVHKEITYWWKLFQSKNWMHTEEEKAKT